MSKKALPFFISLVVLLIASLACNRLTGGVTSGFQATANAAFTQAASGAATAGAQGSSAEATANAALTQAVGSGDTALATANAAATELVATANAATSGQATATPASDGEATATPASDQPTAAATTSGGGGGTTADGGPTDIPLIKANNTILLATAQLVSYKTSADIATTVKFYKEAMPSNGWTADPKQTIETATATVLSFTKDSRTTQVSITGDPTSTNTIVVITIS